MGCVGTDGLVARDVAEHVLQVHTEEMDVRGCCRVICEDPHGLLVVSRWRAGSGGRSGDTCISYPCIPNCSAQWATIEHDLTPVGRV